MLSIFDFLAAIAALQVTVSVRNKWYTNYDVVISLFKLFILMWMPQLQYCMQKLSVAIVHTYVVN